MESKEALELAILEYEKDLEFDENNQWVKNVLKGLKESQQGLNRLEEYRKIEKEIDIDLITLFKAYSNGFYVRGEKEKQYIDFQNYLNANAFKNKEMFYGHEYCYQYVKLYDYGKDWALTKQELEQ